MRADADTAAVAGMHALTKHMAEPTFAMYTRVLERPDPRVPPCVAWDVSAEAKRLLYQGDVFVGHVIDVAAFIGRRRRDARIVKLLRSGDAVTGFGVVVADEPLAFSHEFVTDVLLGFATIESTAEAILEAANLTMEMAETPARLGGFGETHPPSSGGSFRGRREHNTPV